MSKEDPCVLTSGSDTTTSSDGDVKCTGVVQACPGPRTTAASSGIRSVTFVKREGDGYVKTGRGFLIPKSAQLPTQDQTPVTIGSSSESDAKDSQTVEKEDSKNIDHVVDSNELNNNLSRNGSDDEFETPRFKPAINRCVTNSLKSRKKTSPSSQSQSGSSSTERRVNINKKRNQKPRSGSGSDVSKSSSKRAKISSNAEEPNNSASSVGKSPSSAKKKMWRQRMEERRKRAHQQTNSSSDEEMGGISGSPLSRYSKLRRTCSPQSSVKLKLMKFSQSESTCNVGVEKSKARKKLNLSIDLSSVASASTSKVDPTHSSSSTQPPSGYEKNASSVSTIPPENNESGDSDVIPLFDENAAGPKSMTVPPPEKLIIRDQQKISSVRAMLLNIKNSLLVSSFGNKNNAPKSPEIDKEVATACQDRTRHDEDTGATAASVPEAKSKENSITSDSDLDVPLVGLLNKTPQSQAAKVSEGSEFGQVHFGKLKTILDRVSEGRNSSSSAPEDERSVPSARISVTSSEIDKTIDIVQGIKALSDSPDVGPMPKPITSKVPSDNQDKDPIPDEIESMLDDPLSGDESSLDAEYLLDEDPSRNGPNAKELIDWSAALALDFEQSNEIVKTESHEIAKPVEKPIASTSSSLSSKDRVDSNSVNDPDEMLQSFPEEPSLSLFGERPQVHELPSLPSIEKEAQTAEERKIIPVTQVKEEPQLASQRKKALEVVDLTDTGVKTESVDIDVSSMKIKTEPGLVPDMSDGVCLPQFIKTEKEEFSAEVGEGWVYSQEDGVITIYDSDDDYMKEMSQNSNLMDSSDSDVLYNDTIEEVEMKDELSKQALKEVWAQLESIMPEYNAGQGGRDPWIDSDAETIDSDSDNNRGVDYDLEDNDEEVHASAEEMNEGSDRAEDADIKERRYNSDEEMGFMSQGFSVNHSFHETEDETEETDDETPVYRKSHVDMSDETGSGDSSDETFSTIAKEKGVTSRVQALKRRFDSEESSETSVVEEETNLPSASADKQSEESSDEIFCMTISEVKEAMNKEKALKGLSDSERSVASGASSDKADNFGQDLSDDSLPSLVHTKRASRKVQEYVPSTSASEDDIEQKIKSSAGIKAPEVESKLATTLSEKDHISVSDTSFSDTGSAKLSCSIDEDFIKGKKPIKKHLKEVVKDHGKDLSAEQVSGKRKELCAKSAVTPVSQDQEKSKTKRSSVKQGHSTDKSVAEKDRIKSSHKELKKIPSAGIDKVIGRKVSGELIDGTGDQGEAVLMDTETSAVAESLPAIKPVRSFHSVSEDKLEVYKQKVSDFHRKSTQLQQKERKSATTQSSVEEEHSFTESVTEKEKNKSTGSKKEVKKKTSESFSKSFDMFDLKETESSEISHMKRKSGKSSRSRQSSGESVQSTASDSKRKADSGGLTGLDRRSSSESNRSIDSRRMSVESSHSFIIDLGGVDLENRSDEHSDQDDAIVMDTGTSADIELTSAKKAVQSFHSVSEKNLEAVKQKVMGNFNPKSTQLTSPQQNLRMEKRHMRREEERARDERRREKQEKKRQKEEEANTRKQREENERMQLEEKKARDDRRIEKQERIRRRKEEANQKRREENELRKRSDSCDGESSEEGFYQPGLGKQSSNTNNKSKSSREKPAKVMEEQGWLSSTPKKPNKQNKSLDQTKKDFLECQRAEFDRRNLSKELKEKNRVVKKKPRSTKAAPPPPSVAHQGSLGLYRIPRKLSDDSGPEAARPKTDHDTGSSKTQNPPPVCQSGPKKKPPAQRGFSSRQASLTASMLQTQKPAAAKDRHGSNKSGGKRHDKQPAVEKTRHKPESHIPDSTSRSSRNKPDNTTPSKPKSAKNDDSRSRRRDRTKNKDVSAMHKAVGEIIDTRLVVQCGDIVENTFTPITEDGASPMDIDTAPGPSSSNVEDQVEARKDVRIVVMRTAVMHKASGERVVGILKLPGIRKPKGRLRWDPRVKSPEPRPIRTNHFQSELPDSQEVVEHVEQCDNQWKPLPLPRNENTSLASVLDDLILYILNWNYGWLKEQVNQKTRPPIIDPQKIYPNQRNFDTIMDYYKIFAPFVLLETWEKITSDNDMETQNGLGEPFTQQVALTVNGVKTQQGNGQVRSMDILCKALCRKQDKRMFREDDLVMVIVKILDTGDDLPTLALVRKVSHAPINQADFDDPSLKLLMYRLDQRDLIHDFDVVVYKLTFKFRKIVNMPGTVLTIRALSSLRMAMRQFTAIYYLGKNQFLRPHILKPNRPNVFNEGTAILDKKVMACGYHKDQADAICVAAKAALQPYTIARVILIKGPAGSGKSYMIPEMIKLMMKNEKAWIEGKPKILVCAPNDCSLDNLVKMILVKKRKDKIDINLVRIGSSLHPDVEQYCLDNLVRMHSKEMARKERDVHLDGVRKDLLDLETSINTNIAKIQSLNLSGRYACIAQARVMQDMVDKERGRKETQQKLLDQLCSQETFATSRFDNAETRRELLKNVEVICCVLNSPDTSILMDHFKTNLKGQQEGTKHLKFSCVIIDEATSCTELDTLIPLQFGTSKLILLGDTEGLHANVQSEKSKELLLGCSLFKRLIEHWRFKSDGICRPVFELKSLHRAGPEIMHFPWCNLYKMTEKIPYARRVHAKYMECRVEPYMVFDLKNDKLTKEKNDDTRDTFEMKFLLELCEIIGDQHPDSRVVIIAPTLESKAGIRARIKNTKFKNVHVDVYRVESLQGKEHPFTIIPCFTMGNNMDPVGELADAHKCLVALTRTQRALYICGRMPEVATRSDIWRNLINDAANRDKLVTVKHERDARRIIKLYSSR